MEKTILIAVDGSPSAERAIEYAGFLGRELIRELSVTVLLVMNPIPAFLREEATKDPTVYRQLKAKESQATAQAREVLAGARERLLRQGLTESRLVLKSLPRTGSVAGDILFTAERGLYDAVVLGRRGLSKAQELFVGSVTRQVLQGADRLPVWIVGGRSQGSKVLCAVDGSPGSLKAVDHVAFMLGGNPACEITLFHVGSARAAFCPVDFTAPPAEDLAPGDADPDGCMRDFYGQAVKILGEAGLGGGQVRVKAAGGKLGVVGAIVEEVRAGGYGTVVVGRRGANRTFFLGHVSDRVVAKCAEAAVWIVG